MTKRNEAIAILTGGGPAPGMNTVVGSVAKTFLQKGYSVIGLHKGFTGLFCQLQAYILRLPWSARPGNSVLPGLWLIYP